MKNYPKIIISPNLNLLFKSNYYIKTILLNIAKIFGKFLNFKQIIIIEVNKL